MQLHTAGLKKRRKYSLTGFGIQKQAINKVVPMDKQICSSYYTDSTEEGSEQHGNRELTTAMKICHSSDKDCGNVNISDNLFKISLSDFICLCGSHFHFFLYPPLPPSSHTHTHIVSHILCLPGVKREMAVSNW